MFRDTLRESGPRCKPFLISLDHSALAMAEKEIELLDRVLLSFAGRIRMRMVKYVKDADSLITPACVLDFVACGCVLCVL